MDYKNFADNLDKPNATEGRISVTQACLGLGLIVKLAIDEWFSTEA